jgi:hypothetical protein
LLDKGIGSAAALHGNPGFPFVVAKGIAVQCLSTSPCGLRG